MAENQRSTRDIAGFAPQMRPHDDALERYYSPLFKGDNGPGAELRDRGTQKADCARNPFELT